MKSLQKRKNLKLLQSSRVYSLTTNKNIVLGLSGGVDSAVSAAFLMEQGYSVIGITLRFFDDDSTSASIEAAAGVAQALGIAHYVWDARRLFETKVIEPFCQQCCDGATPSPCVFCNRDCKIAALCDAAAYYGAEYVATGHYARVVQLPERLSVACGVDPTKDQSYMLSQLSQEQLSKLVLPLGGYIKTQTRQWAQEHNIPVAHRSESQDLCFVPDDYRSFLLRHGINDNPGPIVLRKKQSRECGIETRNTSKPEGHVEQPSSMESEATSVSVRMQEISRVEEVVGEHRGLHNYTIGQRKGIGVALGRPAFVVEKNVASNTLVLAFQEDAYMQAVECSQPNWMGIAGLDEHNEPLHCEVKVRYRSKKTPCTVFSVRASNDANTVIGLRVVFDEPQTPTAPGQYAVLYRDDIVLGSAVITNVELV